MLDGGEGSDSLSYAESIAGVTVDLATGAAAGGHAEGDTFTGFEHIYGSDHADSLAGDDGGNALRARLGDDTLDGREGDDVLEGGAGADMLDGGAGVDTADYTFSDAGVTVNLATAAAVGGQAEGDTLTGIENLRDRRTPTALSATTGTTISLAVVATTLWKAARATTPWTASWATTPWTAARVTTP